MFEPAPLVDTPDDPIPPGGEPEWFVGAAGAKLRAALFTPPGRARGSVVLSGGRTEPIEKYFETIRDFLDRGFVVLAHDWRGQGLSVRELPDRLKGHARGYKLFLEDYRRLLNAFEPRLPKPWVAVGHSMGGCLTLLALANGESRFASAVLSAPMLGLQFGKFSPLVAQSLMRLNLTLGRAGRYVLGQPGQPFDDAFDANVLTHDPHRFARYRAQVRANPDLALGGPTWGWLDFAFRATAFLANPERLRAVTIPVEILSAADDRLVDNTAQAAAARNLPQGRLITVPGAYHEILMEKDDMRSFFLRVFDALTGKTAPKPAEAPKTVAAAEAPVAAAPAPEPATPSPVAKPAKADTPVAKAKPAPQAKPVAKASPKPAPVKTATKVAAAKKPPAKASPKNGAAKVTAKTPAKATAPEPATKAAAAKPSPAKVKPPKPAATAAAAKAPPAKAKPPKPAAKVAKTAAKAVAPEPATKAAQAKPSAKPVPVAKAPAKAATVKKATSAKPAAKPKS